MKRPLGSEHGESVKTHRALKSASLGLIVLLAACASRPARVSTPAPERGPSHFRSYCAACHQYDGQGVGEAPPLDGSPWVTGPQDRLIKIVLHGVRGKIEVQGRTYDREMPGFGSILTDEDLASLLSFVRSRFGGPSDPIRAAAVGRVRAANQHRTRYWTVGELLEQR